MDLGFPPEFEGGLEHPHDDAFIEEEAQKRRHHRLWH
jgi:hypothetical protein